MTTGKDSRQISGSKDTARANPAALTVEQLARLLGVAAAKVQAHVEAGAPTAANGTINLVHYAAWLNRQLAGSDAD